MVHMVEGVVSAPVIAGCTALAAAGVGYGLTKLKADDMPKAAVVGAAFFVASLIHVPVGPSSAHLLANGLMGLLLGWSALPAMAVALLLQAAFFGFGGVTTLGVNLVLIGLPAIVVHHLFRDLVTRGRGAWAAGFACGALAIALSALGAAVALAASGAAFVPAAKLVVLAHLPVMVVEGVVTAAAISLLARVKPDALWARPAPQPVPAVGSNA
ncbi:cobalt transporter CbiM [Caenispirillum salinarum]|uniref:cobalt transporter CbiM n=1 Tax=Caenispirillum salinarum TaxID=859058 RepID=UPI00384DB491